MILNIKKFYTRENIKVMFFGYVNAIRFNMPTVSLNKAALNFMKHHGLNDDNFNAKSMIQEYERMFKEYIEIERSNVQQES